MVIFISGVYGVGKSTIGKQLSTLLNIPYFAASALITKNNGEEYGANKYVKDKYTNQESLIKSVKFILDKHNDIILDGHFCIINSKNQVEALPEFVYSNLSIKIIVILETSLENLISNLSSRDGKDYDVITLKNMITKERNISKRIAKKINAELFFHNVVYDGKDALQINNMIKDRGILY